MTAKTLALTVVIGVSALAATAANAEGNNLYVQLNGGGSYGLTPKSDIGHKVLGKAGLVGFEVGYQINDHFRAGVGVDYRVGYGFKESETQDTRQDTQGKLKSLAAMANLYYDIVEVNGFTPYITVGAGVAKNIFKGKKDYFGLSGPTDDEHYKGAKSSFAYKMGAGVKYSVSKSIDLDVRYQYANLGKIRIVPATDPVENGRLRAHEAILGLSYKF